MHRGNYRGINQVHSGDIGSMVERPRGGYTLCFRHCAKERPDPAFAIRITFANLTTPLIPPFLPPEASEAVRQTSTATQ